MSQKYLEAASCSPSLQKDVYIFTVVPLVEGLMAAITSADELVLLQAATLQTANIFTPKDGLHELTSLVSADDGASAVCAGRDGTVSIFDIRSPRLSAQFKTGINSHSAPTPSQEQANAILGRPVNTLASRGLDLAVGSETIVSVW